MSVTVEEAVDLSYAVPTTGEVVIQLENRDGSIIINDDTGTVEGDSDLTQFRDSTNTEDVISGRRDDGLWNGYSGTGYLDMGGQSGDEATFDVTVAAAGDYTFVFRYNNGSSFNGGVRPLDIAVNGTTQATPDFARSTDDQGAFTDWIDWETETVTLTLDAGTSTISMTNTVGNGPNLDQVTVSAVVADTPLTRTTPRWRSTDRRGRGGRRNGCHRVHRHGPRRRHRHGRSQL